MLAFFYFIFCPESCARAFKIVRRKCVLPLGVNKLVPGDIKNVPLGTRKRSPIVKKASNNYFPCYQCLQFILIAFSLKTLR